MVARGGSMYGCYNSYSYRLWSLANVWSTCQLPLSAAAGVGKGLSPVADDVVSPGGGAAAGYYIKCPQCHKGYSGFQALKEHVEAAHPPPVEEGVGGGVSSQPTSPVGSPAPGYSCSQCSSTFVHKDQLEKHELLHSPNAQVSCKVCNKTFANVYRLQRHMISHDESAVLRKFKCPECEKAFKFKHHLKEHIRIHSGEKPFECANCGKRFSHSGSYSSHMTSKKCLVMNLKVGRGGRGPNSQQMLDKTGPPSSRAAGLMASKRNPTSSPLNNHQQHPHHNNNNSFPPILPKYGNAEALARTAAFLQAVSPRVPPGSYPHHPHPAAPSLHPFYMAAAPTMHLSNPNASGMPPYKLPPSLSHLLEHLTSASSPPHQFRLSSIPSREDKMTIEEITGEDEEDELEKDAEIQEKPNTEEGSEKEKATSDTKEGIKETDEQTKSAEEGNAKTMEPVKDSCSSPEPMDCGGSANGQHRSSPDAGSNSGDLDAVKRILETVNATVTKQLLEANMQKLSSSTSSSGSGCPSIASASSPAANSADKTNEDLLSCRHCQKKFPSPIDLHQHERYLCDRKSEGLAAKLEEAVSVKTESVNGGGCSGSEEGEDEVGSSPKDGDEENYVTTTDQMSEDGRKVRVRSMISEEQLAVLKGHYSMNPRPKKDELSRIAERLGFPVRVVQVWFQNTRARDRREGRLVHVPYVPLGFSPTMSVVPSTNQQQTHSSHLQMGSYTTASSPLLCPSASEQPLDLSTKKTSHHSVNSSPSCSPLRPASNAAHSDSGEETGAMNLSRKSSSSRSPTPNNSVGPLVPFRQLLPFQQPPHHYPHSSCSSSSVAEFRRTPSPLSSLGIPQAIDGSNGLANSSRLARILAQPPVMVAASHHPHHRGTNLHGLTNGTANGAVGMMPMERLMYGADLSLGSRTSLPIFGLHHHMENGRACSSSPGSDKRSWKQNYMEGDMTDEAEDSGCGGGGSQETDHSLLLMDDDSPTKRHKFSPSLGSAMGKGPLSGVSVIDGEAEGQFICDQCDKAFSKQSSLARHKYEHSGQRPHKCDVCTKAFKHKHHLTEHKRLHSGEKPFQCSKCLKRFSHSGSYSQHMNHRYSYCKPYRE